MHKFTEYRKKPVIQLWNEEETKYNPFSFGLRKAKLVLANLEAIKKFVEVNEEEMNTLIEKVEKNEIK